MPRSTFGSPLRLVDTVPVSSGERVPAGGATGEVLTKKSAANGDTFWSIRVDLTSNQNIAGLKTFTKLVTCSTGSSEVALEVTRAQPAVVATTPGTTAGQAFVLNSPAGGNTSEATTGVAGTGGALIVQSGNGGLALRAKTSATMGNGGVISFTAGNAREVEGAATPELAGTSGTVIGGKGGAVEFRGGNGSSINLEFTPKLEPKYKAGQGGAIALVGGTGGGAFNSLGEAAAANGGEASIEGGAGGEASETVEGAKKTKVIVKGVGGTARLQGGTASALFSVAGPVIIAGGSHPTERTEAANGSISFRVSGVEANQTVLTITSNGAIQALNGIGLWGKAMPAAQPATVKTGGALAAFEERVDKVLKEYGITS